jgi:hypothetical protein
MHSTTVTHSCLPGSAWYFRCRWESTTTNRDWLVPKHKS